MKKLLVLWPLAVLLCLPWAGAQGTIGTNQIRTGAVTYPKIQTQPTGTLLGNNTGSAASPSALTIAQVTSMLDVFTSSLKGLVPASGGGTTNFLRADGTWATPPGGGGGISSSLKANLPAATGGNKGTLYFVTDAKTGIGTLAYSDGAQWQYLNSAELYAESYSSLQAAIDAARATKHLLKVNPGTYTLTSTVTIGEDANIEFLPGAVIRPSTASLNPIRIQANFARVIGLRVDVGNHATYTGTAVEVLGTSNMFDKFGLEVSDVLVSGNFTQTGTCFRINSGGSGGTVRMVVFGVFRDIECRGFEYGVHLNTVGGLSGDYINSNIFQNYKGTQNKQHIRITAATNAEISANLFRDYLLQTSPATERGIYLSGRVRTNRFEGKLWDWLHTQPGGGLAFEITGTGADATDPVRNEIIDYDTGETLEDGVQPYRLTPTNTFITNGRTANLTRGLVIPPTTEGNRQQLGDQDDVLAYATYKYTVTQTSGPVPSCSGPDTGLANLFQPNGQCSWSVTGGQQVVIRVDVGDNDYWPHVGVNLRDFIPENVTIRTANIAAFPTFTTYKTVTNNANTEVVAQHPAQGGTIEARYLEFVFSRPASGNIRVARIWGYSTFLGRGPYVPFVRSVTGATSLTGGGTLEANRTLSLVNDSASPGNLKYYGTNGSGTKGFHDLPAGSGGESDPANVFYAKTDAIGTQSTNEFSYSQIGTGAAWSTLAPAADNTAGLLRGALGTTATGRVNVGSVNNSVLKLGMGFSYHVSRVRILTLSDATNTYSLRSGFVDSLTGESVDGVFIRYTHSVNGGRFECVARNNSTESVADTGVTVTANAWYRLRVEVNAAGTQAQCFINGTLSGTVSANIPTASGRETGYQVLALRSAGTTAVNALDFDYAAVSVAFTTAR